MAPQPRLEGKVAIVTGGASGFGRGVVAKFVEEGGRVIIADLSEEAGQAAAQEFGCKFAVADVTKREDWERLLKTAVDAFGQLDIVVNNAGATYVNKPTEDVTEKDFDLVMNVNVKSVYMSTSVLLPYFLEKKRPGCFIQVASTAGVRPRPRLTWYNASKAAVINATKVRAFRSHHSYNRKFGRSWKRREKACAYHLIIDNGSRVRAPSDSVQRGISGSRKHRDDPSVYWKAQYDREP